MWNCWRSLNDCEHVCLCLKGLFLFRGIIEARFVYVFVLGIVFTGTKDLLKSQVISTDSKIKFAGLWEIYSGLVLLAALLFRPHNLPVLVFCLLIQAMMTKYIWRPLEFDAAQVTIVHYWFGQAFFFFQVSKELHVFRKNKQLFVVLVFTSFMVSVKSADAYMLGPKLLVQ